MTALGIPNRPADRTLKITGRQLHDAMTPWEAKVRSAHLLRQAGFRFSAYDGVKGVFRLKAPWLRTPLTNEDAVEFEQWDTDHD